jgi:hypothetical protein
MKNSVESFALLKGVSFKPINTILSRINPLKRNGNYMYRLFLTLNASECIYDFRMILNEGHKLQKTFPLLLTL